MADGRQAALLSKSSTLWRPPLPTFHPHTHTCTHMHTHTHTHTHAKQNKRLIKAMRWPFPGQRARSPRCPSCSVFPKSPACQLFQGTHNCGLGGQAVTTVAPAERLVSTSHKRALLTAPRAPSWRPRRTPRTGPPSMTTECRPVKPHAENTSPDSLWTHRATSPQLGFALNRPRVEAASWRPGVNTQPAELPPPCPAAVCGKEAHVGSSFPGRCCVRPRGPC